MSIKAEIINIIRARRIVQATIASPYRTGVTAADVLTAPGALTLAHTHTEGGLTAVAHNVVVVARNAYGGTTGSNSGAITAITPDAGDSISVTFTPIPGAVGYDFYCSIASIAPDPLWVGYVTAAQLAAGADIQTVGVVASPGASAAAGQVDIWVVGSGRAALANNAQNTAYKLPGPIDCSGYGYCDLDLRLTLGGDSAAPAVTLLPFFQDSPAALGYAGEPETLTFGGASGYYEPLVQRHRVEARGCPGLSIVVAAIAGTGATLEIYYVLS